MKRFSPASAGNTIKYSMGDAFRSVQPRERGEHSCCEIFSCQYCGSAPRARGTHKRDALVKRAERFSPASAGNTHRHSPIWPERRFSPASAGNTATR